MEQRKPLDEYKKVLQEKTILVESLAQELARIDTSIAQREREIEEYNEGVNMLLQQAQHLAKEGNKHQNTIESLSSQAVMLEQLILPIREEIKFLKQERQSIKNQYDNACFVLESLKTRS